jgi:hypothetical protein
VLNERRKQLVHLAFRTLDRDGSGQVDMADIKGVYNASSHPDVITGKRTEEEVRSCACFPLLMCERGIWQFHLHKSAPAPSILSSITVVVSYFRASRRF